MSEFSPMEELNNRKLREQEEEWAREQAWVEESQMQTLGEMLGVNHLWRKIGAIALTAGLLFGADKYVNYKVDQITDRVSERVEQEANNTGREFGKGVVQGSEEQLRETIMSYLDGVGVQLDG